jgi:hypothetical protein
MYLLGRKRQVGWVGRRALPAAGNLELDAALSPPTSFIRAPSLTLKTRVLAVLGLVDVLVEHPGGELKLNRWITTKADEGGSASEA